MTSGGRLEKGHSPAALASGSGHREEAPARRVTRTIDISASLEQGAHPNAYVPCTRGRNNIVLQNPDQHRKPCLRHSTRLAHLGVSKHYAANPSRLPHSQVYGGGGGLQGSVIHAHDGIKQLCQIVQGQELHAILLSRDVA